MLYELLKREKALGAENSIPMQKCAYLLKVNTRTIKRLAAQERAEGKLICSAWTARGGYYLPTTIDEIEHQKKSLEKGFVSRANAVRAFRQAVKKARSYAGGDLWEMQEPMHS